jgi:hypothetical protein
MALANSKFDDPRLIPLNAPELIFGFSDAAPADERQTNVR